MLMSQLYSASLDATGMTHWLEKKVLYMASQLRINVLKLGGVFFEEAANQRHEGLWPFL